MNKKIIYVYCKKHIWKLLLYLHKKKHENGILVHLLFLVRYVWNICTLSRFFVYRIFAAGKIQHFYVSNSLFLEKYYCAEELFIIENLERESHKEKRFAFESTSFVSIWLTTSLNNSKSREGRPIFYWRLELSMVKD